MTNTTLTLTRDDKTATALIRHERSTSKIRYAEYVEAHNVTLDTVPDHVQALANLAGEIRKWESPAERKAFCTKIRNGLKYHLAADAEETDKADPDWLRLVRQAAENAHNKGEIPVDKILAAVAETLNDALLAERETAA